MTTNNMLVEKIKALAGELDIDPPATQGRSNKSLLKVIQEMNEAVAKGKGNIGAAPIVIDEAPEPEPEREIQRDKGVYVAAGKSIISARGILGPDEKLLPDDISVDAKNALLKKKILVKI